MATWQDGPEYAPFERPAAFVVPPLPPLPAAPDGPAPVPEPEAEGEPSFSRPQDTQPDLAALVPAGAPGRNPNVPFEVSVAAIAAGGRAAGSPTGERAPTEPFTAPGPSLSGYLPTQAVVQPNAQVNPAPFPAPNTPAWFAPPPQNRVPAPPPSVSVGQIWRAATPGVLVPLLLGMVFSWLSLLMLAVSFALSARIPYRRETIRNSYLAGLGFLGIAGLSSLFSDSSSDLLFEALSGAAQFVCFVLPIVVGLTVGSALRAGERPDRFA